MPGNDDNLERTLTPGEKEGVDAVGVTKSARSGEAAARKARAAQAVAKRNTERNFRNIQQCLLSENLDLIKNYHKQNNNLFKYQTFRQINGAGHKVINKLRGISQLEEFLNIRTAVLSALQPKIRIYKVTYVKGKRNPGQRGGPVPARAPIYKEIKFSDNFGKEVAPNASEYMKHEMTKPNWRNVGLQQFTFKQMGRSFGAIEHNIQCTMEIYSKGLKDLLADASGNGCVGPDCPIRYVDLLLYPEEAYLKTRDKQQPNPKHYEIKAFIGYSKIPKNMQDELALTPSERRFIKNIEKFNFMLTLTMIEYDFNIAETGETTTTINFWGKISTATTFNTDVFDNSIIVKDGSSTKSLPKYQSGLSTRSLANLQTLLKNIVTAKKNPDLADADLVDLGIPLLEDKLFRDLYKKGFGGDLKADFSVSDVHNVLDVITTPKGAGALNGLLKRASASLKNEVYKSFMLQLLDGKGENDDTRLFAISVNKENLDGALGIMQQGVQVVGDADKAAKKARREEIKEQTSNAIGLASQTVRVGRPQDISGIKQSVEEIEGQANENASNPGEEQRSQEALTPLQQASQASLITSKTMGDRYEFYFLYLGDIIELAAKNSGMFAVLKDEDPIFSPQSYNRKEHGTDYGLTNVRLLLGPLEYSEPNGRIQRINLAEFPVSFDLFRTWFLEKIVRTDRTKMDFKTFLGTLITNLVLPAMGADCLRPVKLANVNFENIFMTLPGKSTDAGTPALDALTEELLPIKRKIDIEADPEFQAYARKVQIPVPYGSLIKNSYDYQLVQTSGYKHLAERSGNCKEDIDDGIYHFNIGSDRGLLKVMNFTKVNIPFQQERMSKVAIDEGGNQLQQLSFTFNCNLELIGNTLFIPGMIFYANPSFAGLGDPTDKNSVSHQLKLGGYFLVLETKIDITPGQFKTSVVGEFVAHPKVKV